MDRALIYSEPQRKVFPEELQTVPPFLQVASHRLENPWARPWFWAGKQSVAKLPRRDASGQAHLDESRPSSEKQLLPVRYAGIICQTLTTRNKH